MRVFCAVELPAEVRALAASHIERLRRALPDVRASWDRPEKLHVTVKFLGEIEETRLALLERAARDAASSVEPFELSIEGAGAFPQHGPPRVLWLGVQDSAGGLARLQNSLEAACAVEGFAREPRPFHPHLTIVRLRQPRGTRELSTLHREHGFSSDPFRVTDLLVIKSELGPGGSRYTVLTRRQLGAGGQTT